MKNFFLSLICGIGAICGSSALAQSPPQSITNLPASVAASSTNYFIGLPGLTVHGAPPNSGQASPQPFSMWNSFAMTAAGTNGTVSYIYAPSYDGLTNHIATNSAFTITANALGTAQVQNYGYVQNTNYYGAVTVFLIGIINNGTNTLYPSNSIAQTAE